MNSDQIIGTILLRDRHRRFRYQQAAQIVVLLLVVLCISVAGNFRLASKPLQFRFLLTDVDGRLTIPVPITQKKVEDEQLKAWAVDAITRIWTFDFSNYRTQLQDAQRYMTVFGWKEFEKALAQSGNFNAVIANRYSMTAAPTGPAVILSQGISTIAGSPPRYTWQVELPVIITYRSSKQEITQPLKIKATVGRMPEYITAGSGLAIRGVVAR
jgi:intracellular multiplication protein IcmL